MDEAVRKAWIEDDYGDGPTSQPFFGYKVSNEQIKNADKVRSLVNKKIGSWTHYSAKAEDENLEPSERKKITAIISRGLPIQWVKGDADKAESSFFKINTKGTPLDDVEELLLRSRKKPISIAARAIIRAGKGHRYWSSFDKAVALKIEELAKNLHAVLFDPEIKRPIKSLDLPLGGPKGVRAALQSLIDLALIATRDQTGVPKNINDTADDSSGTETIKVLTKTLDLAKRVTGNEDGSLGLHPAVYFYGPTGRHSGSMYMGTMTLIGKKMSNNDKEFFKKFTAVRSKLENILINQKDLIATILQKHLSPKRVTKYAEFLDELIHHLETGATTSEQELVTMAGLDGKVVVGSGSDVSQAFSDDTKSKAFIYMALAASIKCNICSGYLDTEKSVSYDHALRVRDGGDGSSENCSLTHPYCNQSVKH